MTVLLLLVAVLAWLPLLIVDVVFALEVGLGLLPSRRAADPGDPGDRPGDAPGGNGPVPPRIALLVPAHNEEQVVRASVAAMRAAAPPGTRLLVVAHNCGDRTAEEAALGGAEVHRLDEPARRGKGYALAGGRDALAALPPDGVPPEVVIVVDADCVPAPGSIARLAATALAAGRATQASYLFRPRGDAEPMVQISNFALLVKNLVRQRGARRIGGPALLTGSGMAFPWPLFATLDLATGNIVEDLALGVDLVASGRAPLFEDRATIWSTPSNAAGTGTQRARWEGGFVATARSLGLPLLARGLFGARGQDGARRWAMIWMGLHLLVLPLTLVLAANGAALLFWTILWLLGLPPGPALLELGMLAALLLLVLAAWAAAGRAMLSGATLLRLPFYLAWKIGLYARILRKRETPAWVRTERVE